CRARWPPTARAAGSRAAPPARRASASCGRARRGRAGDRTPRRSPRRRRLPRRPPRTWRRGRTAGGATCACRRCRRRPPRAADDVRPRPLRRPCRQLSHSHKGLGARRRGAPHSRRVMLTFMTDTLAAKQAITEVLYRYCRGLDRMDRALALSVWHADGTARYEEWFDGTGAAFVDWVCRVHAEVLRHSHQITNVRIEVDGDRAVSESYVTVCLRTKPHEGG